MPNDPAFFEHYGRYTDHIWINLNQREVGNHKRDTMEARYGFRHPRQFYTSFDISNYTEIATNFPFEARASGVHYELPRLTEAVVFHGFTPNGRYFVVYDSVVRKILIYEYKGLGDMSRSSLKFDEFFRLNSETAISQNVIGEIVEYPDNNYFFTDDSKYIVIGFSTITTANVPVANPNINARNPPNPNVVERQRRREIGRNLNLREVFDPTEEEYAELGLHRFVERDRNNQGRRVNYARMPEEQVLDAEELDAPNAHEIVENRSADVECVMFVAIEIETGKLASKLTVNDVDLQFHATIFMRDRTLTLVRNKLQEVDMFELDSTGEFHFIRRIGDKTFENRHDLPLEWFGLYGKDRFHSKLKQTLFIYIRKRDPHFFYNEVICAQNYLKITQCYQFKDDMVAITFDSQPAKISIEEEIKGHRKYYGFMQKFHSLVDHDFNLGFLVIYRVSDGEIVQFYKKFDRNVVEFLLENAIEFYPRSMAYTNPVPVAPNFCQFSRLLRWMAKTFEKEGNGESEKQKFYRKIYNGCLEFRSIEKNLSTPYMDEVLFQKVGNTIRRALYLLKYDDTMEMIADDACTFTLPFQFQSRRSKRMLFEWSLDVDFPAISAIFHPFDLFGMFIENDVLYALRPVIEKDVCV